MHLNLLVIRSNKIHELRAQYEVLGLNFQYHRHGKGLMHYSAETEGLVFEIYPAKGTMPETITLARLGFSVQDLALKIPSLKAVQWKVLTDIGEAPLALPVIVEDLDGRKVELTLVNPT